MPYRCCKCKLVHDYGVCNVKLSDENPQPPSCVNCGEIGHPANYRNCSKYKEIEARFKKRRDDLKNNRNFKARSFNNYRKPNLSYAGATRSALNERLLSTDSFPILKDRIKKTSNANNLTAPIGGFNILNEETHNLFGCDLFALITKVNQFIPNYKKISDVTEKKIKLLTFIMDLSNG